MSDTVKIGQIWQRKNGSIVEVTGKMESRLGDVFELTPLGDGRKSWKRDKAIAAELLFISKSKKHMIL